MSRSHFSSLEPVRRERLHLAKRKAGRQELDRFFSEFLSFLNNGGRRGEDAGRALSDAIAAFAFDKFGALAPNVQQHWGIDSPDDLGKCFCRFLKACGSHGTRRLVGFAHSEALQALFRGDFWP